MQRQLLILFFLFHVAIIAVAQIPTTWSIDSTQSVWSYEDNAIYFKRPGGILKSDYAGNEIWARQYPFQIRQLSIDKNSIVCFDDTCVYRLDTSGNVLWARSFVSFICPGVSIQNTLGAISINGKYIYVSLFQYNLSNYQSYNSMVVFDTLGFEINSWCDQFLVSLNDLPVSSIKSIQSGAWILRTFSTGLQRGCIIVKVDSIGNVINRFNTGQSTYVTHGKIIPLADSNYFTFNNYYSEAGNKGQQAICLKFDEQGNTLWVDTIRSTGVDQFLGFIAEINSATSDDSSNIYLYGRSLDDNDSSRNIVIKLDPSGNLLFCKAWVNQSLTDIHYHNGYIYSGGGNKIFDTSFYSPCYATDTSIGIIFYGPSGQFSGFTTVYPTINYMAAHVAAPVSNLLPSSLRYDLCLQNGLVDKAQSQTISIYPNPATDQVHVEIKRDAKAKYHLDIFNQIGVKVYSEQFSSKSHQVNCSSFHKGIYFVRIYCSEWSSLEKLVVE